MKVFFSFKDICLNLLEMCAKEYEKLNEEKFENYSRKSSAMSMSIYTTK